MDAVEEAELCFPLANDSCTKTRRPRLEATSVYVLLSVISLLTVTLNLLVIVSISHFRQLHGTTNLLLLSLAVSDLLVGLLLMPVEILLYGHCWILGDFACAANFFLGFLLVSASVGNMMLISVDRYMAICDAMFYSTRVSVRRVQLSVCLNWMFSAVHSSWLLRDKLSKPGRFNSCHGECVITVNYADGLVDLFVTFFGPVSVIVVLYTRVFVVAVSQAQAVRSQVKHSGAAMAKKSELKAARTLGVVVVVFLLCSCPYYYFSVVAEDALVAPETAAAQVWLLYLNSCLNPLIYTFFYPWFRKSVRLIVTLKILQPDSCEAKML
ncbi:trace amine-associated receptor 13c-like [Stegastes partitus]|uniref:Trace amine-associated receptor 13c-like n=1 Tax=Stegastes partitus TaxID=144197 RepID=A0A9Y4KQI1_9TELE|nr:PREDICTED: trace amine-associated receptor 13c-like [Stegastes partitus]